MSAELCHVCLPVACSTVWLLPTFLILALLYHVCLLLPMMSFYLYYVCPLVWLLLSCMMSSYLYDVCKPVPQNKMLGEMLWKSVKRSFFTSHSSFSSRDPNSPPFACFMFCNIVRNEILHVVYFAKWYGMKFRLLTRFAKQYETIFSIFYVSQNMRNVLWNTVCFALFRYFDK